jgi:hypothetical protein
LYAHMNNKTTKKLLKRQFKNFKARKKIIDAHSKNNMYTLLLANLSLSKSETLLFCIFHK